MVKKNKFSKSCNAIEVKYIGTFFVFLWAFSTRHYICIGSGCVIGSGVLLPPPSLPFKPYIISVDMPWWSQPQLELDDLKLTIWGNNVLYCWYCYEFSLIMATYVLHSFDLHWLTLGSFMCTAKGSLTWIQSYYCGYWKDKLSLLCNGIQRIVEWFLKCWAAIRSLWASCHNWKLI